MIIAGLTGGIGHGKTTFAALLAEQCYSACHFESWELVAEVAEALRTENVEHPLPTDIEAINRWLFVLPEIVQRCVHANLDFDAVRVSSEQITSHPEQFDKLLEYLERMQAEPSLANGDITADTKEQYRSILQWLGGYLVVKVGPGVWYDEIVRRIAHLRGSGYELVTVGGVRYPGDAERLRNALGAIIEIKRPAQPEQDRHDLTERERAKITPDTIVINNGSLADLKACASIVYEDLRMRQLHDSYTASV